MNRSSDPGLGQWLITTLVIVAGLVLIYYLIQFSGVRAYLPTGLEIANLDVGSMDEATAQQVLTDRYLNAPVVLFHGDQRIEIDPQRDAEFRLDMESMMAQARFQDDQQDFWSGFWGYMIGQPVEVDPVDLRATHNRETLRESLRFIASQFDDPAQPPQPVPATLSFQYGEIGRRTNIEDSLLAIEAALYRPVNREATLVVEPIDPPRPNINLLTNLIVNNLEGFPGVASVFILDLETGDEIAINADVAISGMSTMKVPIVLETLRVLDAPPQGDVANLIEETLLESGNFSANLLLDIIAGEDNGYLGADSMTASMQVLGLENTFIVTPYEEPARSTKQTLDTPANLRNDITANPDPNMQTTAEEIGSLMAMVYFCAESGGGALGAAFDGQITQEECQLIVDVMSQNFIGSLIEEGVPSETQVAHKHGWISDTHGDAGIVYSPGGDYVIVMFLHQNNWLEWAVSSPLMADISQATYNYFNFDAPFLEGS
ncbi:MAG: serine hydrolase [Ardenticatenaceae bacterium]|nr:serine hydrolase [Ardenticatenaceae bacterium]